MCARMFVRTSKRSVLRRVDSVYPTLIYCVGTYGLILGTYEGEAGSMIVLRTRNLGGFRGGVQGRSLPVFR